MKSLRDSTTVVTGATGMVGSHLVAELVRNGCRRIIAPVRSTAKAGNLYKTLEREGIEDFSTLHLIETPLDEAAPLSRAVEGGDIFFHCAAAVSIGGMSEEVLVGQNTRITESVVGAALSAGAQKLIYVSSIATLGASPPGEKYITEDNHIPSASTRMAYSRGKLLSEKIVLDARSRGIEAVIIKPSTILGAGNWRSGSSSIIPFLCGGMPFYTDGVTAFVDVRDVARAMIILSQSDGVDGQEFIAAGENIPFRLLMEYCSEASGKRSPRWKLSPYTIRIAGAIINTGARLAGGKPVMTKDMARILLKKCYYSGEKLRKTVNFEYTPINETVRRITGQYLMEKDE